MEVLSIWVEGLKVKSTGTVYRKELGRERREARRKEEPEKVVRRKRRVFLESGITTNVDKD